MNFCKTYYDLTERFIPSRKRIAINQGGTRSGKTYSIIQFLIETAIRAQINGMEGRLITIVRKTMPALKATAMRDFMEILEKIGYYSEENHNKSLNEYHLCGSVFEFISLDQPTKVRGRKRDILFVNEANELDFEDWRQLLMRTTDKVIIDYNPSDEYHWLYDHVHTREDAMFFQTSYLDNPFLEPELIAEIERLKDEDENYWKVYGLGERGASGETIYTNWKLIDEEIQPTDIIETAYGLDFGFNNASALIKCMRLKNGGIVLDELIHRTHLTNNDLIQLMRLHNIGRSKIYCDHENDRITELTRAGFHAVKASKDVKAGIDKLKAVTIYITKNSSNLLKEIKNYKWKTDKKGNVTDEPVKFNDHSMDAARYGSFDLIAERKLKARVAKMI